MKILKRVGLTAMATLSLVALAIAPAHAVGSGWKSAPMSYSLNLGGCSNVILTVYPFSPDHYASASDGSCSGSVGVQTQYQIHTGSPVYTTSIKWGTSYARQDVEILRAGQAHR